MVQGGKTSVPYLLCPECQSSGNLFILILVVPSKSSLSSIWVFWDLCEGHPGYCEDITMLFFANLDPSFLVRIFDILCIHCIFHTAFDPPPRLLPCCTGDCARFRWQGFSAGRFRSGSVGFGGRNSVRAVTWKMDETYWNWVVATQIFFLCSLLFGEDSHFD